jgi:hypothetical protein
MFPFVTLMVFPLFYFPLIGLIRVQHEFYELINVLFMFYVYFISLLMFNQ